MRTTQPDQNRAAPPVVSRPEWQQALDELRDRFGWISPNASSRGTTSSAGDSFGISAFLKTRAAEGWLPTPPYEWWRPRDEA